MARGTKDLMTSDKETLLQLIEELRGKLKKKNSELHRARLKLSQARSRMMKMKDTVEFQRKRIIELY
ncbi:MAG TPA: hypothetical protein VGD40_03405 [Chryseosolibacter sp.]